jgi:hypothetical protein
MRILFVGRSVYHFTYYESVIRALYDAGHALTLLFDEGWSKNQPDAALRRARRDLPAMEVAWLRRRADRWRQGLFGARELRSVSSYLRRPGQSDFYLKRWQNYLPPEWRKRVAKPFYRRLLGTWLAAAFFAAFERAAPADDGILADIGARSPDALVVSPANMRFSEEIEYVKAARKLGVPTAVVVLSWDNLTTKGLIHVRPDLVLAWNEAHAREAARIHNCPRKRIAVIGSPFFDKWFEAQKLALPREVFFNRIGLANGRRFVLYLGSSANIARDETWLVKAIAAEIRKHPDPEVHSLGVLVRPHPANTRVYEALAGDGLFVWPKQGALPEDEQSQSDFFNSLLHCEATVGINTSGMVDAVIVDRPVLTVLTETYEKTQKMAEHFQLLLESSVLGLSRSPAECAGLLAGLLVHSQDPQKEARRRFVEKYIRPFGADVSAGRAAAAAIEALAGGVPAGAVPDTLRGRLGEVIQRGEDN